MPLPVRSNPLFCIVGVFAFAACQVQPENDSEAAEFSTLSEALPRQQAERATAALSLGAGKLTVVGGSNQLIEADFEYSQEAWKPVVKTSRQTTEATINISQPNLTDNIRLSLENDQRNAWSIQLNDQVRYTLTCRIGAGATDLDLSGLLIDRLSVDAGVGEHRINLTDTSLPRLDINVGVGEVHVDLTGEWRNHLRAEIDGGIGGLTLAVPQQTGVRLNVSGALGSVDVPSDYTKDKGVYTNAAYKSAEYRLEIDIDAGIGSIEVEEAPH